MPGLFALRLTICGDPTYCRYCFILRYLVALSCSVVLLRNRSSYITHLYYRFYTIESIGKFNLLNSYDLTYSFSTLL